MKDKNLLVYVIGVIIFIFFITYSHFSGVFEYIEDSIIILVLFTIIFFSRKTLKITPPTLSLIIIAFAAHTSGVFGFYNVSPLPIQYDHFTHFLGIFVASILIFKLMENQFTKKKSHNALILLMILFASLGVGALVEQTEYIGFLKFGTGPGLLRFGGLGDTPFNEENLRAMDAIGGGWINTMLDINYNFLGALTGIILMYLINKFKHKK